MSGSWCIIGKRPVTKPRPVYLSLLRIRLPLPGIVSILHRISGFVLFLFLAHFNPGVYIRISATGTFKRTFNATGTTTNGRYKVGDHVAISGAFAGRSGCPTSRSHRA